jgi:glycosyltransferase involved in cell wall biosynthesis
MILLSGAKTTSNPFQMTMRQAESGKKNQTSRSKTNPVVMQVIPRLGAGGAEQGCIDIAAELAKTGATSIVVSNGGNRVHEIIRGGSIHINLPVDSKNPVIMWKNISRLRKLIRQYDVDIVHARSRAPAWSAMKACAGTKARFMTTCHAPFNISGTAKKFYNSSIARGERVIAISNYVKDYLLQNYQIDERNIRVIHRGIAPEKFHPGAVSPSQLIRLLQEWRLPDVCSIVLMPGRLTRWKGQLILIEAMSLIKREDVFCILIGDDQGRTEYRKELEGAIHASNLEGRVRIVGHCNDMPAAYLLANVVVSASTEPEGFGRVPVEAQAMGRPVIATAHGGAIETIIPGLTGWLVPPGDATALAEAINEALSLTDEEKAFLAAQTMVHVEDNFTKERMVRETLDVYAELLQAKYNLGKPTPAQAYGATAPPLKEAAE